MNKTLSSGENLFLEILINLISHEFDLIFIV